MKVIWWLFRAFSLLSGFIMLPALFGLGLAWWMGFVPPWEKLRDVFATSGSDGNELAIEEPVTKGDAVEEEPRLWESRLGLLEKEVARESGVVAKERTRLEELSKGIEGTRAALARTLSAILDRPIESSDVVDQAATIEQELERIEAEEKSLPQLIETLRSMDSKALAAVFSGANGQGLSERQSLRLLRGLPPRKSAQVLEELSKADPARASSLVEQLAAN